MKNWKKRFTSLLLAIVMCLSLGVPALAADKELSINDKRAYLTENSGIPEGKIYSLSDEMVELLYIKSQGSYITEAPEVVTVANTLEPQSISQSKLSFEITVYAVFEMDRVTFREYDVMVRYEWLSTKQTFLYCDGIDVNWPEAYLSFDQGFAYYSYYKNIATGSWVSDKSVFAADMYLQGGLGLTFDYSLAGYETRLYKGLMSFQLRPVDSNSYGKTVNVNATFAHTDLTVSASEISVSGLGSSVQIIGKGIERVGASKTVTIGQR